MNQFIKAFFFITLTGFFTFTATAQKPVPKKAVAAAIKTKQPKLYTSLAGLTDSSIVTVEKLSAAIGLPLKIVDDKNNSYIISSYQFLYKRKVVTEDEQTGKLSPASSIASKQFRETPMSDIWVNTIREQLIPGEELFFFDVVAKDANGRIMMASNLKIFVQ